MPSLRSRVVIHFNFDFLNKLIELLKLLFNVQKSLLVNKTRNTKTKETGRSKKKSKQNKKQQEGREGSMVEIPYLFIF